MRCHLQATRHFHASCTNASGHSRWSKIKHDKGKNDAFKNRQRSIFAAEISTASKMFGPDPNINPRLADLITKAKREGFAKTSIESAIARGQGRSISGANLETVVVEAIMPNNVGVVMECETDNKNRTLHEVRHVIKLNGGSAGPTGYLFDRRGRIVFDAKEGVDADATLNAALDVGALDVDESEDGRTIVLTEPEQTTSIGKAISEALKLEIASSGVVYVAKSDTATPLPDDDSADVLSTFLDGLEEKGCGVQVLAMNATQGQAGQDSWRELSSRLE